MEDMAPALLEAIRKDFRKILGDAKLKRLDYLGAEEYAETVGEALAQAFRMNISPEKLPEGRMFWNIADRVIRPMLELDHKLVSDAAVQAQQALNKAAGLGLKAQKAPLDEDKVSGILNKVANAEDFSAVAWVLDEPVKTFSRAVVDDTLKHNVDFQGRAGLRPRVIRTSESHCCRWCSSLAGVYEYPDVPKDVYRRHENCRCSVEYDPGDGKKVQNVHTKKWISKEESAILKKRKNIGLKDTLHKIVEHPLRLSSKKPEELAAILKSEGYELKPLKQGSLKNISLEDGGGYKVNFEDGGLFQYHPAKGSHHKGAYYKISTGKGGVHRYDLDGKEKKE